MVSIIGRMKRLILLILSLLMLLCLISCTGEDISSPDMGEADDTEKAESLPREVDESSSADESVSDTPDAEKDSTSTQSPSETTKTNDSDQDINLPKVEF